MNDYQDFTIDTDRFSNITKFVKDIATKGIKFVPIIDAGIA